MASLVVCGAINWDTTCFIERLPSPGEEVRVTHIGRVPGGTAANVAVAAARILGTGAVALVGALGDDDIAHKQEETLIAEGVIIDGILKLPDMESGQAFILVDSRGQNVIATSLGANAALRGQELRNPVIEGLLRSCQAITITDPPLEVVQALVNFAEEHGLPTFWDPGVLLADSRSAIIEMIRRVDTLFCNEVEAQTLFDSTEPDAIIDQLQCLGFSSRVVLKLGDRGAVLLEPLTMTVVEMPVFPLSLLGFQVVDTVGCGDAFLGTFSAYYILGSDAPKALSMAGVGAAINATRHETRGSPDRSVLESSEERARNMGYVARRRRASS